MPRHKISMASDELTCGPILAHADFVLTPSKRTSDSIRRK